MASKRKDKDRKVLRKGETQRKDNTYMYRWTNSEDKKKSGQFNKRKLRLLL